jgi:hypothetical protein
MAAAAAVVVAVVVADVAGNSAFHTRQLSPGEFTLSGALVFGRRVDRIFRIRGGLPGSDDGQFFERDLQRHASLSNPAILGKSGESCPLTSYHQP